jgi:hypothetical protein
MMYSTVYEAFDNPTKKDNILQEVSENQNKFNNNNNNPKEPTPLDVPQHAPGFFTAQGNLYGTSINDLHNNDSEDDSFSLPSILSNSTEHNKKFSHEYCVSNFVNSITKDDSSNIGSVYDHIKNCKQCRDQIRQNIKQQIEQKKEKFTVKGEQQVPTFFGYDLKEIALIVIAGIILICILDLIVKVGRKARG